MYVSVAIALLQFTPAINNRVQMIRWRNIQPLKKLQPLSMRVQCSNISQELARSQYSWMDCRPDTAQHSQAFSTSGIGLSVLRVRAISNSADLLREKPTIDLANHMALVIASAWTAPASMKDNNNTVGGKLKTASYTDYAAHLSNFCSTVGGLVCYQSHQRTEYFQLPMSP